MNKTETIKYNRLLKQAITLIRQDAEGKFALAALARDMIAINNDVETVATDLGLPRWKIVRWIEVLDYWGDERLPEHAWGNGGGGEGKRPAGWSVYEMVVLNPHWRDDPSMIKRAKRAAIKNGYTGLVDLIHEIGIAKKQAQREQEESLSPAQRREDRRRHLMLQARTWLGITLGSIEDLIAVRLRTSDVEELAEQYAKLTELLTHLGVVASDKQRVA